MAVGAQIFDQVVMKMMRGKTRLITLSSHLHCLRHFDRVVVMGKVPRTQPSDTVSGYEAEADAQLVSATLTAAGATLGAPLFVVEDDQATGSQEAVVG
jgi:hypothetical protein